MLEYWLYLMMMHTDCTLDDSCIPVDHNLQELGSDECIGACARHQRVSGQHLHDCDLGQSAHGPQPYDSPWLRSVPKTNEV